MSLLINSGPERITLIKFDWLYLVLVLDLTEGHVNLPLRSTCLLQVQVHGNLFNILIPIITTTSKCVAMDTKLAVY